MSTEVPIPDHLLRDVQQMVEAGEYPDIPSALTELVRIGIQAKKQSKKNRGGPPRNPSSGSDEPTGTDPHDVNWM